MSKKFVAFTLQDLLNPEEIIRDRERFLAESTHDEQIQILFSLWCKLQVEGDFNMFTEAGTICDLYKIPFDLWMEVFEKYEELDKKYPDIRTHFEKIELIKLTSNKK